MKKRSAPQPGFPCREKRNGRREACAMDAAHCRANFQFLKNCGNRILNASSLASQFPPCAEEQDSAAELHPLPS